MLRLLNKSFFNSRTVFLTSHSNISHLLIHCNLLETVRELRMILCPKSKMLRVVSLDIQENYVNVKGPQILRESMNILIISQLDLVIIKSTPLSHGKANNQLKTSHQHLVPATLQLIMKCSYDHPIFTPSISQSGLPEIS